MNDWYISLKKAPWTPPNIVFSVIWPILYMLMFVSLSYIWTNQKCYPFCNAIFYFFIQLFFNLIWTTLFFKWKQPLLALIDLILMILFTIYTFKLFYEIHVIGSLFLIPYILWLFMAFSLNFYIVLYN